MELTRQQIEAKAEQLYTACPTPKPHWQQLGEGTKSVWREKAVKQLEKETK